MPLIKLGLTTGTATTLPPIRWMSGSPDIGGDESKQLQTAVMSDGSKRFASLGIHRRWSIIWEPMSAANVAILKALNALNNILKFQNNWESATWYDVVITSFKAPPLIGLYGGTDIRYSVAMTLEEI